MNRKLHDGIGAVCLLPPTTVSADTASAWLDLRGFGACDLIVRVEALTGDGSILPKVQEGDTTATSGAAAAAAGDVVGDFAAVEAASDLVTQRACYCGGKRYTRVLLDVTGTASATITVFGIAGQAISEPAANPSSAAAT